MLLIEMRGICKHFPGVVANDHIDFQVKKQEIHCLLGENGSGKTTLMNILYGLYRADEGEIFINEKRVEIHSPHDAVNLGIGMVHQNFMLVNQLTVFENIILGHEQGEIFIDKQKNQDTVQEIIDNFNFKINLNQRIKDLSVGMKQRVEIIKTIYRGADIIILDEPTAVLTPQDVEVLFKILKNLVNSNKTIIFITHKLNETLAISDRVTILNKGKNVAVVDTEKTNYTELVRYMVGRNVEEIVTNRKSKFGRVVLELERVKLTPKSIKPVDMKIRSGEILGIAGVEGNGQFELEEMVVGTLPVLEGKINFLGQDITGLSIRQRKELGIGYIPSDRLTLAMLSNFSVKDNFLLGYQDTRELQKHGFINRRKLTYDVKVLVDKYQIKVSSIDQEAGKLSGGNQQKLIIAKETNHKPKLIIAAQPTRGLDIGAIEYVHKTLLKLRDEGIAILLISAELSEILNLSDYIAVLYEGEISAYFKNGSYSREQIGLFMTRRRITEAIDE